MPTVSLHEHERIDPQTIIQAVRKSTKHDQLSMFSQPRQNLPLHRAIEFYRHSQDWSNRLIAGDSLLVMNSLLQKEGFGGKVQTVYMDPPYGIRYRSNFQPFVNREPASNDRAQDLSAEPEMLKAFRDTWEIGIHSYLSYMRDRLLLARELLNDSGSCFVQIGKENLHRVGLVMDEVFGADNRIATITYTTTGSTAAGTLSEVANYLLWYAKDSKKVKYHQLYEKLSGPELVEFFSSYAMVEEADGSCRKLTIEERADPEQHLPEGARLYSRMPLTSQSASTPGRSENFEWEGRQFHPGAGAQWRVDRPGLERLAELSRLDALSERTSLRWKLYSDEVPGRKIHNVWAETMSAKNKSFVVQTAEKVIQRALLMTTDPGDLVLDPTCGSGTTAVVAEQWGRRWITCDSSRVALTVARQRLMTEIYPYYRLVDPDQGVGAGFRCPSVQNVSAGSLAYNKPADKTVLYDQPEQDSGTVRVTGPFTVEAVPAPTVKPLQAGEEELQPTSQSGARTEPSARYHDWCAELEKTGVRGKGGQRISFNRLDLLPGTRRHLHATGETAGWDAALASSKARAEVRDTEEPGGRPQIVAVCFGPEHAPLGAKAVQGALQEAQRLIPRPEILIFAAFHFDETAAQNIDETDWPGVTLLKAKMNTDLQTGDLKKGQPGSESFLLIGQPDIRLDEAGSASPGQFQVEIQGFDYFDVLSGEIQSGDANRIAVWMLDTDYNGRSLFPRQVFLPMADKKRNWSKLLKNNLRIDIDPELLAKYSGTKSLPFKPGEHRQIAVKIVDDRGIESLRVLPIEDEKP